MLLRRLGVTIALTVSTAALAVAADEVSFSRDIRPIFAKSCESCHGPSNKLGGLNLATAEGIEKGGVHGPAIAAGDPAASRLIGHLEGSVEPAMPLGSKLPQADIDKIAAWIRQGAQIDDAAASASVETAGQDAEHEAQEEVWWAFQPPSAAAPGGGGHPIDAFLAAKRAEMGVEAAPQADRRTLIRRVYLDLVGLLPPPEKVEAFVNDDAPDAWPRLIDELLASPRYGERWGRHWLDVVRYADSAGYEHDFDFPDAWRFRDYVIQSFNEDKPYDRFIREQLAGDELQDWNFDTLVATGFYRIGPRVLYREKDNPEYRYTYLDDMIATTSRAFLAMSVDCARCHDHKFDPISQVDYYRMLAVFFPHVRYEFPLASDEAIAAHEAAAAAVEARTKPLEERIQEIQAPYREIKRLEKLKTFPQEIQDAVNTPEAERTEGQRLLADQVLIIGGGPIDDILSDGDREEIKRLLAEVKELEKGLPPPLPTAMGVRDGDYRSAPDGAGDQVQPGKGNRELYTEVGPWIPTSQAAYKPPTAHLLPNSSDIRTKGPEVEPGVLSRLASFGRFTPQAPENGRVSTGRRLALANWIASPENPLTARVMANRVWQHHFGTGIVLTASNFGKMGRRPSHPELLDWLANRFIDSGWSIKSLHRLVLTSEAYRMASSFDSKQSAAADPNNVYLWRYPTRRVEAEALRDITLDAAGSLNVEAGGEPFFPPIPKSVYDSYPKGRWTMTEEGPAVWRRSVYSYWKRGLRYPMFDVFDQPNMNVTCESRTVTTVPTQALTLLNNEFILLQAERFARRVAREAGDDPLARIARAYEIALSRQPTSSESEANRAFLARQKDYHNGDAMAALTDLCDVVLNLNEFVYVP